MMDAEALVFVVDDDACIWGSSKDRVPEQLNVSFH